MHSRERTPMQARHGGALIETFNPDANSLDADLRSADLPRGVTSELLKSEHTLGSQVCATEAQTLLPSPAPLPSLPAAFSRRAALFGSMAATGFLGAGGTAALGKGYTAQHIPSTLAPADAQLVTLCDKLHDNKAKGDDLCGTYPGVDCDSVPGWFELEGKRSVLLYQITETPAVTMAGIAAKARVLQVDTVRQDYEWLDVLSASIAEDVLRIQGGARG